MRLWFFARWWQRFRQAAGSRRLPAHRAAAGHVPVTARAPVAGHRAASGGSGWPQTPRSAGVALARPVLAEPAPGSVTAAAPVASGRHRRPGEPADGIARPAIPGARAPFGSPVVPEQTRPGPGGRTRQPRPGPGHPPAAARAAVRPVPRERGAAPGRDRGADRPRAPAAARLPWYEVAHARRVAAGQRDCGPLEAILHREWIPGQIPPPEAALAVDRLADLPEDLQRRLAAGLDSIHVGPGGVPDLDHMARLRGIPLPSGRATWDSCAGAYGERKIIVGTRPSSAPDVMCHEVGHALDDIDGGTDGWQSDSAEFRALYERCLPVLVSDFHKQEGPLGRREFFADAFSAIASRQRPALVDMLGGHTRVALDVMLFFNIRYGI
jgi:hypothetical protein